MQSKLIATAVGAFGLGALVGWAISADIHENRLIKERESFDQIIREKGEHIWALKEELDRPPNPFGVIGPAQNWSGIQFDVTSDQSELFTEDVSKEEVEKENVIPEGETPEETRTNLQKLIDTYTADQDAQQDFVSMASVSVENDRTTPPFVISKGAYAWSEEGDSYEKITLTYFPHERVLLDDDEDPVEDVAGTVGWRSLSQFGGESEDPNIVFVRNRRLATDFEVVKEEDTQLPLHIKYGMEKHEFRASRAAGQIKLRQEDDDR